MQNIIILFALPFVFFKSIDDYRSKEIISKRDNNYSNSLYSWHFATLALFILLFFIGTLLPKIYYIYSIIRILFLIVLILFFLKRENCIFNETLEFGYEGLVYLTLTPLIFSNNNSALIMSSCILISSLSAGISKLNCKIWEIKGDGFLRFLILPWLSRRVISKTSSTLYKNRKIFRFLVQTIHTLVPWIQILSALSLIYFKFFDFSFIGILFPLLFQVSFALILFFIADLSWIPFFYIWLVTVFAFTPISINNDPTILFFENLSLAYLLIYFYMVFIKGKKIVFKRFYNFFSIISIPFGPFEMFTERNIDNMITHYIVSFDNYNQFNAFDKNGLRSKTQNLSSRHLFCTLYTLGDFLVLNSNVKTKRADFKFKSPHNRRQCLKIFKAIKNGEINFFQHVWVKKDYCFKTYKIAKLEINKDHEFLNLSLINYSQALQNQKRV